MSFLYLFSIESYLRFFNKLYLNVIYGNYLKERVYKIKMNLKVLFILNDVIIYLVDDIEIWLLIVNIF